MRRLREAFARLAVRLGAPADRGASFWVVTVLLGLLLPAPVAVAVIAARLRRGTRQPSLSRGASSRAA